MSQATHHDEATAEYQRHQRQSHEHLQEYLHRSSAISSSPTGCEKRQVEHWTDELSQSLAEGSHYQNLYTTIRSGASESSSEIQQFQNERDHVTVHSRILETETPACQCGRCIDFRHHPEPTQHARDKVYLSTSGVDATGRRSAWICCHRWWRNGY